MACSPATEPPGLVVGECKPWGAAARAGLEPGDRILGWFRGDQRGGELRSPLDLMHLEAEESPRGPLTLRAWRDGRELELTLSSGEWELEALPALTLEQRARRDDALDLVDEGKADRALAIWERLAEEARDSERPLEVAWFRLRNADALVDSGREEEALDAFERAREALLEPARLATAFAWEGRKLEKTKLAEAGQQAHRRALEHRQTLTDDGPSSPSVGASMYDLVRSMFLRGQYDRDDLVVRTLEIYEAYPRSRLERARCLNIRGNLAWGRRELDKADAWYRQSLTLYEEEGIDSPRRANVLGNLGFLTEIQGDLVATEAYSRAALAMNERLDPESLDTANALNYVALSVRDRGDLEAARNYMERALEIFERERAESLQIAGMLNNLGNLAARQGDLELAGQSHRRALALRQKLAPTTLDEAASLTNLGRVLLRRGDLAEARKLLESSLAIKKQFAPRSLEMGTVLTELAEVERAEDHLDRAEELHRRALQINKGIAEGRWEWAANLFFLGDIALAKGRLEEGEALWRQAVDAIESRRQLFGSGTEDASRFAERFQVYYRSLAELLANSGRQREAFELVENVRARALRHVLAQRASMPDERVSASLIHERNRLERSASMVLGRLGRADPIEERDRIADLRERLKELRRRQLEVAEEIRRAAPDRAALREAAPVALVDVGRTLGSGTVLVSYSVGESSTLLFVVSAGERAADDLKVYVIPHGREELRNRISTFRSLIERGRRAGEPMDAVNAQGRWLYERLLGPGTEEIEDAERLLVVADGPLHDLPFAALVHSEDPMDFMAGWMPMAFAASAGVFTELGADSQAPDGPSRIALFGDPAYPVPGGGSGAARGLIPLPHARREVESIAALFPDALIYLGREATEAKIDSIGSEPMRLHFAAHALLDDRFPLNSALALTPGTKGEDEGDDGLLHAWEVMERLRLNADLVTLSACDTGRGEEVSGEGILGLARAFQYAGARSLLVSQWTVSDRSTADLMVRFYRLLENGSNKTDALARAQQELLEGGSSHPYHWAGFRILGDWQ
ncbi:MAG: CHAT domain-containing protein [bacterium]|nr:CHAT domain-containing protein [bacterium]